MESTCHLHHVDSNPSGASGNVRLLSASTWLANSQVWAPKVWARIGAFRLNAAPGERLICTLLLAASFRYVGFSRGGGGGGDSSNSGTLEVPLCHCYRRNYSWYARCDCYAIARQVKFEIIETRRSEIKKARFLFLSLFCSQLIRSASSKWPHSKAGK